MSTCILNNKEFIKKMKILDSNPGEYKSIGIDLKTGMVKFKVWCWSCEKWHTIEKPGADS